MPPVALVLPADIAAPVAVLVLTVVDAGLFLSGASPFLHALLG